MINIAVNEIRITKIDNKLFSGVLTNDLQTEIVRWILALARIRIVLIRTMLSTFEDQLLAIQHAPQSCALAMRHATVFAHRVSDARIFDAVDGVVLDVHL